MQIQFLDRDDLLEEKMATLSSILARKIPWRGACRLQSMGLQSLDMTEYRAEYLIHFYKLVTSVPERIAAFFRVTKWSSRAQQEHRNPELLIPSLVFFSAKKKKKKKITVYPLQAGLFDRLFLSS